ncbi:C3a anaphylatoxin chemotactic receptor-like [Engystomops pustulosus]|uniref:C3a anaphylatoxin chemotactic receptor-like n=1 Tax=Engystomops pustulosus TaxID=76066 RepID=UPI003AFA26A2
MDAADYQNPNVTSLEYDDPSTYNSLSGDYEMNDTDYGLDDGDILQRMSITLYSIIFILGIIGNGLVIWIAGFRMKKTISAVWFLNLAIADFLCCTSTSLQIVQWAFYFSNLRDIICILIVILFHLNMSASVLLLTAMSVDRWVSVMWPFWAKFHRTQKVVRITAGIIWGLSLLLTCLLYSLHEFYSLPVDEWCLFYSKNVLYFVDTKQTIHLIRLVVMFVIPFLIIVTSYVSIFLKIRKSKRPQRSQRSYRIITAVILCFVICWAPYYICPLTPIYDYNDVLEFYKVNTIVIILACLNSCVNPIIYVFMGQDFKHSFLRSIPFRREGAFSEHPDDPCKKQYDHEPDPTKNV